MKIAFVGSSHLSVCNAIAAEMFSNIVYIFDIENENFSNLRNSRFELNEPFVEDYLKDPKCKIIFSSDFKEIEKMDLVFISQDIKVEKEGISNKNYVEILINKVLENINSSTPLIIMSQVEIGFTRRFEKRHDNIFYQMETLVFGQALQRLLNQDRIVVGSSLIDQELPNLYKKYLNAFKCPIIQMKFEEAEFTKQCVNIFLASSICTTNSLAEVSENLGLSWSRIVEGVRGDKRIGKYAYLMPGLGIGGVNLIRDLVNLKNLSEKMTINSNWYKEILNNSEYYKNWLAKKLLGLTELDDNTVQIGVIGVTYKENISSIEGSATYNLIRDFKENFDWKIFDPTWRFHMEFEKYICTSVESIFQYSNIIIIGNKLLQSIEYDHLKLMDRKDKVIIIDPYNVMKNISLPNNILRHTIGDFV